MKLFLYDDRTIKSIKGVLSPIIDSVGVQS